MGEQVFKILTYDDIRREIQRALIDVIEQSQTTENSGIAWGLRVSDGMVVIPVEIIGNVGGMEARAECLRRCDEQSQILCAWFHASCYVLSRQNQGCGGAIFAGHYVLSVFGLSEIENETVCLLVAVRLGWITKKRATAMAKINDEKHPNGNIEFLKYD